MADSIIERMFIAFGVKTDDIQKGMAKAEQIVENSINHIKDAIMPLATGFALAGMVTTYTEGANTIAKASDMLAMSIEDLQAWQGAAESMGAEGEEINEMLIDMNEYLVDMVQFGSGPAVDILKKLGISATDASGKIRPATEVLLDMAEAGEKISKQEMLAYGKIMGFDKSVIDLLMKGRKGLEELLNAQKELAVFSKEDAEISKQSRIAWQSLIKALQALQATIMRVIMPAFITLTNWFTKAVIWARQNQPFITALFAGLAMILAKVFIPALVKMGITAWSAMAPFLPFIAIIVALALAIDDLWTYFEGGEAALSPVLSGFIALTTAGLGIYKIFGGNIIPLLISLTKLVGGLGLTIIKTLIPALASLAVSIWGAMAPLLPWIALFAAIGAVVYGVWKLFTDGEFIIEALKEKIGGFFDWVTDKWNSFTSWLSDEEEVKAPVVNDTGSNQKQFTNNTGVNPIQNQEKQNLFSDYGAYNAPLYGITKEDMLKITNPTTNQTQTNNITNSTSVGNITINTSATNASEIAKNINPALQKELGNNNFVMAANTGVIAK